jgi:threonylcarbamoyladenosine tRNA methylthiotransferase MtaB
LIPELFAENKVVADYRRTGTRTRKFVKIQDGCDAFCTYCIIPYLRGKPVSVPVEDVLAEVKGSVSAGFKEIVLTGIHIGLYKPLDVLLDSISLLDGEYRIRLSSLNVDEVDRVLSMISGKDKICPHFHISLQSGSEHILRLMGRKYTTREFINATCNIRKVYPHAGIGIDIITGFPGEQEIHFLETVKLLEDVAGSLDYIHIFPYSPRQGTAAAAMDDQIRGEIKKRRAKALKEIDSRIRLHAMQRMIGQTVIALTEGNGKAHTENYHKIILDKGMPPNQFVKVTLTSGHFIYDRL